MRLRFDPRITGSRIRPLSTDGIAVCPHPADSRLMGEVKWKQSRAQCFISAGWILPGSLLLWRTSCAQREEQRKELWVSFLPSLPSSQLDWLEDTCCAQGVCGWRLHPWGQGRESQWGPGVGDAAGCRISSGPLLGALPRHYNEPLISADLIKELLLTGGWGAPRASGRGCWAAQNSSLGMGDQDEEGETRIHWNVLSRLVEIHAAFPWRDLAVLLIKECYVSAPSGMS